MNKMTEHRDGMVYFIGAGPGDPELLTLRAKAILERADVVVYTDSLVSDAVLRFARSDAKIYGSSALTLEDITAILVGAASQGKIVARLHTGDPSLYGALSEQMVALERRGVKYEIVPGVSSLFAAAATLRIGLTAPGVSQTVIIARHPGRTAVPESERLRDLAAHGATLAVFLSAGMIEQVVQELLEGGYTGDTPAAVVHRASWPDQQVIRGALANLAQLVREAGIKNQAIILVGRALDAALPGSDARSKLYDVMFGHGRRQARQL